MIAVARLLHGAVAARVRRRLRESVNEILLSRAHGAAQQDLPRKESPTGVIAVRTHQLDFNTLTR